MVHGPMVAWSDGGMHARLCCYCSWLVRGCLLEILSNLDALQIHRILARSHHVIG